MLPPTPPDAGADDEEDEDAEGPRETDERDPPSTARETTEVRRAPWLLRAEAAETGALDVATPPRTATTIDDGDADADGSGNVATVKGTLAARAPHAFPRAAARMVQSLSFLYVVGTRRASASALKLSARGGRN